MISPQHPLILASVVSVGRRWCSPHFTVKGKLRSQVWGVSATPVWIGFIICPTKASGPLGIHLLEHCIFPAHYWGGQAHISPTIFQHRTQICPRKTSRHIFRKVWWLFWALKDTVGFYWGGGGPGRGIQGQGTTQALTGLLGWVLLLSCLRTWKAQAQSCVLLCSQLLSLPWWAQPVLGLQFHPPDSQTWPLAQTCLQNCKLMCQPSPLCPHWKG